MVGLNQTNKILYIELVSLWASNMEAIQPREAFRLAFHKLAIRVILVHNHPSGDVEPSEMDQDLTVDGGQDIVEIMREAAGRRAHGFNFTVQIHET